MQAESNIQLKLSAPRDKILQQIKDMGYEVQNNTLIQNGFTKLAQNRKYLGIFKGDVDKILEELKDGKSKKSMHKSSNSEPVNEGAELRNEEKEVIRGRKGRKRANKSKENRERIANNENLSPIASKEYSQIPSHIEKIYLDGNNMLFVEAAIRNLVVKGKRREAEEILAIVAFVFGTALKAQAEVVLVFDRANWDFDRKIVSGEKSSDFTVLSASPKYKTSDDALVDWAQELGSESVKKSLFITSDRELQERLTNAGVSDVMKPGNWFKIVREMIGDAKYSLLVSQPQPESEPELVV